MYHDIKINTEHISDRLTTKLEGINVSHSSNPPEKMLPAVMMTLALEQ